MMKSFQSGWLLSVFLCCLLQPDSYTQTISVPVQPLGGTYAFKSLLYQEMYYPASLRDKRHDQEVGISFVVDTAGQIKNVHFDGSPPPAYQYEALRLLNMAEWQPANIEGIKTSHSHFVLIPFSYNKYVRQVKRRGYDAPPYPFQPSDSSGLVYESLQLQTRPQARFHDGSGSIREYLTRNLRYPEEAIKRDIQGTVILRFIVEPSGRSTNIHAVQTVGAGCDEESIRLVESIHWIPGIRLDNYVRSWVEMSITFRLPSDSYKYHPTNHSGNIH